MTSSRRTFLKKSLHWGTLLGIGALGVSTYGIYRKIRNFKPIRNAKIPSLRLESSYPLAQISHPEVNEKYADLHVWVTKPVEHSTSFWNQYQQESFAPTEHHKLVIIGGGPVGLLLSSLILSDKPLLLEQNSQLGGTMRGEIADPFAYSYLQWRFSDEEKEIIDRSLMEFHSAFRKNYSLNWLQVPLAEGSESLRDPSRHWLFEDFSRWRWTLPEGGPAKFLHEFTKYLAPLLPPGNIRTQAQVMRLLPQQSAPKDSVGIIYRDGRGKPVHLTAEKIIFTAPAELLPPLFQVNSNLLSDASPQSCIHFAMAGPKASQPGNELKNQHVSFLSTGALGPALLSYQENESSQFLLQGITSKFTPDHLLAREVVLRLAAELGIAISPLIYLRMGIWENLPKKMRAQGPQPVENTNNRVWLASRSLSGNTTFKGAWEMASTMASQLK